MFSQTTKIPAKVYRSTDTNAPQLTATSGCLKTLLKACLVTGYGEDGAWKEPLGWEMLFEEPNNAVFRSKSPESAKYYLQCLNEDKTHAVLTPYRRMSELMTGDGYFGFPNALENRWAYAGNNNATDGQWLLVGCDRAFWLVVLDRNKTSQVLFFGDARPLAAADNTCFVYVNSNYSTTTTFDSGALRRPMIALGWQLNTPVQCDLDLRSQYIAAYPDPIHGGLLAHDVFVLENKSCRAVLPALLHSSNDLQKLGNWETVKLDGDDAEYVYVNISDSPMSSACFLLNTSYFEYA